MTYIKQTLSPCDLASVQENYNKLGLEVTITRISTKSVKFITIVGVYRPPSTRKEWFSTFNSLLQEISHWVPMIILGDLNADLMAPFCFPGNSLLESLALANASVFDVFPTRLTDQSASCLDIIAIDQSIDCLHYTSDDLAASDHFPVIAEVNLAGSAVLKPIYKRNFKKVNEAALQHDLSTIGFPAAVADDVNSLVGCWYEQFNSVMDRHAPFKNFPFKNNYLPWISERTKATMHLRDATARKMKTPFSSSFDATTAFDDLKLLKKKAKGQLKFDLKQFGADSMRSNDPNKIWSVIRSSSFTVTKGQTARIAPT